MYAKQFFTFHSRFGGFPRGSLYCDLTRGNEIVARVATEYYKRDFWIKENLNYAKPHFRLEKAARVVNRIAGGKEWDLSGCWLRPRGFDAPSSSQYPSHHWHHCLAGKSGRHFERDRTYPNFE
jgi:hypothetical protein